jgi:hypothetical protein
MKINTERRVGAFSEKDGARMYWKLSPARDAAPTPEEETESKPFLCVAR